MKMVDETPQPIETLLPHQVWGTLDTRQQQLVLQIFVSLCQQIIQVWEKEQNHEQHPKR